MNPEFDARAQAITDELTTVLSRWIDQPSPYRSFGDYQRALAGVYQARADLYTEVIQYAIDHPGSARGIVFAALCQAEDQAQQHASEARHTAEQADREDAERARQTDAEAVAAGAAVRS